jgi:hypothetical protein
LIEQLAVYGNAVLFTLGALPAFLSDRFSSRPITYLGETGTTVFLGLSSFTLLCIGGSIIWSGVVDPVRPLLTARR